MRLRSLLGRAARPGREWLFDNRRVDTLRLEVAALDAKLTFMQEALGRIEARQNAAAGFRSLQESEFRVFSQWGEDGIIQALVREVPLRERAFVEFGVEDYTEANTRFLLLNYGWRGLVIEADADHVARIRQSREHWLYDLQVAHSFITRDNINGILRDAGMTGEIGLLSVDIDGNDYWVWDAIDVVQPTIVVAEYNYRFGPRATVTVPYAADFSRFEAHPSWIYYGASLGALCHLAERKGYDFVGCGRAGVNAFFVRKGHRPPSIPALSAEEGFVPGSFAEPNAMGQGPARARADEEMERIWGRGLPLI
ncbi:hypothetical protein, partial [Longimicrobium sp.]|uniref:hypothetical protein n=1 Tax=Longimicrobium sp. TaxID=2029185 RepID=UPI002F92C785